MQTLPWLPTLLWPLRPCSPCNLPGIRMLCLLAQPPHGSTLTPALLSLLCRHASAAHLRSAVKALLAEVALQPDTEHVDGAGRLLAAAVAGGGRGLHSRAPEVLGLALQEDLLTSAAFRSAKVGALLLQLCESSCTPVDGILMPNLRSCKVGAWWGSTRRKISRPAGSDCAQGAIVWLGMAGAMLQSDGLGVCLIETGDPAGITHWRPCVDMRSAVPTPSSSVVMSHRRSPQQLSAARPPRRCRSTCTSFLHLCATCLLWQATTHARQNPSWLPSMSRAVLMLLLSARSPPCRVRTLQRSSQETSLRQPSRL